MSNSDTGDPREIVIKVDGKLALTVQMIAAQYELARNSVATIIERERVPVAAMLDGKKAVYFAADVKRAMAARPGKAWRKGKGYTPGADSTRTDS
jgi:hypothetical protein